ncbi:MAG: hypothetical protein Q4B26_19680, partial [Eubacteriales bacterium]|nr:hypothetical protein [Eubacteriales bacterium]
QDQLELFCDYEKVLEKMKKGASVQQIEDYKAELQSLSMQMKNRAMKRERLYEDFTDKILTPEEYMSMKKKFDDEYQELNARYNDVQTRLIRLRRALSDKNPWMSHIRKLIGETELHTELLDTLIEKITLYKVDGVSRVEIQYKYVADFELIQSAYEELIGGDA